MSTTRDEIIAHLDQEVLKQERLLGLTKAYRRAVLAREGTTEQCRTMAEAKVALLHPSDQSEAREAIRRLVVGPVEIAFKDTSREKKNENFCCEIGIGEIGAEGGSIRINDIVLNEKEAKAFRIRRDYARSRVAKIDPDRKHGLESIDASIDYVARHLVYLEDNKRRQLRHEQIKAQAAQRVTERNLSDPCDDPHCCPPDEDGA